MRRLAYAWTIAMPFALAGGAAAQTEFGHTDVPPLLRQSPVLEPPPPKPASTAPLSDRGAIFLRADTLEGVSQKWVEATGKVELRAQRDTVLADWLRYDFEADEVWGKGNVLMRRGIDWIAGPEARYKRSAETGFFTAPKFQIGENSSRGDAAELIFVGPERYDIVDARYTTCVAGNEDWYLQSGDLDIDKLHLVGTARDATLYFKGVPILYSPWLNFPLSNERKSGFLTPALGSSNSRGFELAVPYYWNIAPNYDATFVPRLMTRRGLQLNGQFRYLFPDMAGEFDGEVLPDDRQTGTTRYAFEWKHNQNFNFLPGLAGFVDVTKVSDNTYFADLSDRLVFTSQTNLLRAGGFVYSKGPFSMLAQVQTYQTLQDPNNPITPPYFREPQVVFNVSPVEWRGFDVAATGEFVRFRQSTQVQGERTVLYPTIAWDRSGSWWNFSARTGLHMTHYDLENPGAPDSQINRVLPITSVGGGLTFEREASYFGQRFIQTLEPRLYYVYIPFRQQSQIPVFDTAQDDFNFSQLFTENQYLGSDRINDANQLTFAVGTRLLDPDTAEERARFAIGQRYYFEGQQVTLTEPPRTSNTSDLLLAGEARLSDAWALAGTLDYNLNQPQTETLDLAVRWQPRAGRVLNASYRFNLQQTNSDGTVSQLKQVDISGQWPLFDNWSFVGNWNYSLVDGKTLEAVGGFEYNGGCWVLRIVAQRLQTNTQQTNTSVFVQLELNGLARLGTSPLELLRRSIPGFQKINDPAAASSGGTPNLFPEF